MLKLRCVTCDNWLPVFQLSTLCETCYKIRTIVKAYNSELILKSLQENFLVEDLPKLEKSEEEKEQVKEECPPIPQELQASISEYANKDKCIEELKAKVVGMKKKK